MISYQILNSFRTEVLKAGRQQRNIGILAPVLQKATDPIQQLFVDKIREYKQKSNNGKNLVEPTPELEKELKQELQKVANQYGATGGEDMTKFPSLKFTDPVLDPINLETKN